MKNVCNFLGALLINASSYPSSIYFLRIIRQQALNYTNNNGLRKLPQERFKHSFFRLTLMHALIHCAACKYGLKGYTLNVTKTILFISLLKFFGSNIGNVVD